MEGGTKWQRSRWMWNTSLSMDTLGIHLQTQKFKINSQLNYLNENKHENPLIFRE